MSESPAHDHPRRLALLFRNLLHCGFFGPALPPLQTMVVRLRMPKRIVEDALALLHKDGLVELNAGQYRRIYPESAKGAGAPTAVRPRIAILTERNIFGHYFEVYQDYFIGVAELAEASGLDIVFAHDLATTEAKIIALEEMVRAGVKGVAVLGRAEAEFRAGLKASGLPTVICGNASIEQRDFGCICSDNIFGTKNLVNYLIKRGHRAIGYYVTAAHSHDGYHHRLLGYRDAMAEAGLAANERMVLDECHSASSSGTAVEIFTALPPRERPSAIVCGCDRDAFELISELEKSGVKVPRDVSVAGFENSLFNTFSEPALTTVDIFPREMGRVAGGFLATELKSRQLPARIVLPSKLIQRDSVLSPGASASPAPVSTLL